MSWGNFVSKYVSPVFTKNSNDFEESNKKSFWKKFFIITVPLIVATILSIIIMFKTCARRPSKNKTNQKFTKSTTTKVSFSCKTDVSLLVDYILDGGNVEIIQVSNPNEYLVEILKNSCPILKIIDQAMPCAPKSFPLSGKSSHWELLSFVYLVGANPEYSQDLCHTITLCLIASYSHVLSFVDNEKTNNSTGSDEEKNDSLKYFQEKSYMEICDELFMKTESSKFVLKKMKSISEK